MSNQNIPMNASILQIENMFVTLNYKPVLKNINFQLFKKDTLIIMGKNSSGKTVLLKSIMNILPHKKGTCFIFGKEFFNLKFSKNSYSIMNQIGYVFQESGLFDSMSILDNITFSLQHLKPSLTQEEQKKTALEAIKRVALSDVSDKYPYELSGGMRKRVGLARAIAHSPKLLIMDDPAAGLDPVLTDTIRKLILKIRDELDTSFIITTHDLNFAYSLGTHILLLINGYIHKILPVDIFKTTSDPTIKQFREGLLEGPIDHLI